MSHGEGTIGAAALGTHAAFRDYLPIKMSQLFQKPDILKQHRAARSGGHNVLVIDNGAAAICRQALVFVINKLARQDFVLYRSNDGL